MRFWTVLAVALLAACGHKKTDDVADASVTAATAPEPSVVVAAVPDAAAPPVVKAAVAPVTSKLVTGACPNGLVKLAPLTTPAPCYTPCKAATDCAKGTTCSEQEAFGRSPVKVCMAAPTAAPATSSDRFKKNIMTEGDCPPGFVADDPYDGSATCARSCTKDADCHGGRKCQAAHTADGKVCSDASSPSTDPPSKCKPGETEMVGACVKMCVASKDCAKNETCADQLFNIPGAGPTTVKACTVKH